MKLKSVLIYNFQSHKHTIIDFAPGVNVVIGLSDAGKSALFRAILWVLTNRPLGEGYRSNWGGDTRVELTFEDGLVVERVRTAKENKYVLNGQELKAVGADVPEEVVKALNLDRFVNIQTQIDPFFLIQASPGDVAKHFNQVAGLQEIDTLMKLLIQEYNTSNREKKRLAEELKEEREKLKEYDELVTTVDVLLNRAEVLGKDVGNFKIQISQVSDVIAKYYAVEERIESLCGILRLKKDVDSALSMFNEIEVFGMDVERLRTKVEVYKSEHAIIDSLKRFVGIGNEVSHALSLWSTIDGYNNQVSLLSRKLYQYQEKKEQGKQLKETLIDLKKLFEENMPDICPLCGQEVKHVN